MSKPRRLTIIFTDDEMMFSDSTERMLSSMDPEEALALLLECNQLFVEMFREIVEACRNDGMEIIVHEDKGSLH